MDDRSLPSSAGDAGTVWPLSEGRHPSEISHHHFAAILHDSRDSLAALSLWPCTAAARFGGGCRDPGCSHSPTSLGSVWLLLLNPNSTWSSCSAPANSFTPVPPPPLVPKMLYPHPKPFAVMLPSSLSPALLLQLSLHCWWKSRGSDCRVSSNSHQWPLLQLAVFPWSGWLVPTVWAFHMWVKCRAELCLAQDQLWADLRLQGHGVIPAGRDLGVLVHPLPQHSELCAFGF